MEINNAPILRRILVRIQGASSGAYRDMQLLMQRRSRIKRQRDGTIIYFHGLHCINDGVLPLARVLRVVHDCNRRTTGCLRVLLRHLVRQGHTRNRPSEAYLLPPV